MKQVLDGHPAKEAGMKDGDIIDSVEGKEGRTTEEFQSSLREATLTKNEVRIVVKRGGEKVELLIKKK
ncbi:MAG: PDZ domain-containing protein [Planctomycetota bacterium]|nr:PDZ domain-containing protein [Planctomycetota bacterium]